MMSVPLLASLPALVEKIRAVCQRVLERVFPPSPFRSGHVNPTPPKAPVPVAGAARAAQDRGQSQAR